MKQHIADFFKEHCGQPAADGQPVTGTGTGLNQGVAVLGTSTEWLRDLYAPAEFKRRTEEREASVKRRAAVFQKLLECGEIDRAPLDAANAQAINRLLNIGSCKLRP